MHIAREDADVGLAVGHRAHDFFAQVFAQIDLHGRVLREKAREFLRQVLGDRGGVGEHAHMALDAFAEVLHVAAQVLHLLHHALGVVQHGLPRGREAHALRTAVQQLAAHRLFHLLDARGRGGQRDAGLLGAAREAARVRHVDEQFQVEQVEVQVHRAGTKEAGGTRIVRRTASPAAACGFVLRRGE
ncbi:hypothetical protein D9M69_521770 [compost metagenome]